MESKARREECNLMALGLDRVGSALWPDVTSMQPNGGFILG
jgi:hypothetical protein